MTEDEMKNKYTAFVTEISEILGLGKPVDIIKLCATTDLFFRPLEKRIAELEQEVLEVRQHLDLTEKEWGKDLDKQIHYKTQLTKAKEIIKKYLAIGVGGKITQNYLDVTKEAEQFLSEVEK
jgi:hypothetical protein